MLVVSYVVEPEVRYAYFLLSLGDSLLVMQVFSSSEMNTWNHDFLLV